MWGGFLAAILSALVVEALQAALSPLCAALLRYQNHRTAMEQEWHGAVQLYAIMVSNL